MVVTRSTEKKDAQKNVEMEKVDEEDEEGKSVDEGNMNKKEAEYDSSEDDRAPNTNISVDSITQTSLSRGSASATTNTGGRRGGIIGLPPGLSSSSSLSVTKSGLTMVRAGLTMAPKTSLPSSGGETPGLSNRLRPGISFTTSVAVAPNNSVNVGPEEVDSEENSEYGSAEDSGEEEKATDTGGAGGVGKLLSGPTFAAADSIQREKTVGGKSSDKDENGRVFAGVSVISEKPTKLEKDMEIVKSRVKGGVDPRMPFPRMALSRLPPGMQVSKSKARGKEEDAKIIEGAVIEKEGFDGQDSLENADKRRTISRLPPGMQPTKHNAQLPLDTEDDEENENESDQRGSESADEHYKSGAEEGSGVEVRKKAVDLTLGTSTRGERSVGSDDGEDRVDVNEDRGGPNKGTGKEGGEGPAGLETALSRFPPGMQITTQPVSPQSERKEERKKILKEEWDTKKEVMMSRSTQGLAVSRLPPGMQISRPASLHVVKEAQGEREKELDYSGEESDLENKVGFINRTRSHASKATSLSGLHPGLQVGKSLASNKKDGGDSAMVKTTDNDEHNESESDEVLNKNEELCLPSKIVVKESGLEYIKPLSRNAPVEKSSDDEFEDIIEDEDSEDPVANEVSEKKPTKEQDGDEKSEVTAKSTASIESKTPTVTLQPPTESQYHSASPLAPLLPLRTKQGLIKKQGRHLTSQLQQISSQLAAEPDLLARVTNALGHDAVRNYTDAVQVLVLSGEEECTDTETKSLYFSLTNIVEEESLDQFLVMDGVQPLSNFALRVTLFIHLQKLVYKEPNLKELIVKEVGLDYLNEFDFVTNFYSERDENGFIKENVVRCTWLYHKIRNLSLGYVLKKLGLVYTKMKPVLSRPSTDPGYISSVGLLSRLMAGSWREQVLLSEERNYDFDFLITILQVNVVYGY